jgi:hypothetical protein
MGIMVIGFVALILPTAESTDAEKSADERWRIVYGGYTLITNVLGIIFIIVFMQNPSLNDLIL